MDFHCQSLIYWLLIFLFMVTLCSTWDPSFPARDPSDPSPLQWKLGALTTGQLGKSYWFLNFMTELKKMKVVKWPSSHTIKFFRQQRIMMINFFIRFSSQVQKRKKKNASGKESTCQCRRCKWFPGQEDALEKEMATHSSIFAWEIPRTEEPGGLHSMGLVAKESDET